MSARSPFCLCHPAVVASIDDEIDALYALAPDAFIAARNALARRAGTRAAEVKALAKPSAPAWAVNQLFWHRRPLFDALVRASEARRSAHVEQMAGRAADVVRADARHRSALKEARDAAVGFLRDVGDAVSPATLLALERTLEVVPSPEICGRLVRPLEPVGFSTLAALMSGVPAVPRAPADVVVMKRGKRGSVDGDDDGAARPAGKRGSKAGEAEIRRAEAARRREQERLKKAITDARKTERDAADAFAKAREAAERAGERVAALERELDVVRRQAWELREEADRVRSAMGEATAARVALERELHGQEESQ